MLSWWCACSARRQVRHGLIAATFTLLGIAGLAALRAGGRLAAPAAPESLAMLAGLHAVVIACGATTAAR